MDLNGGTRPEAPDVSIGGPGFCFPVERWNGREYKVQRWEYEGKACKPPR